MVLRISWARVIFFIDVVLRYSTPIIKQKHINKVKYSYNLVKIL